MVRSALRLFLVSSLVLGVGCGGDSGGDHNTCPALAISGTAPDGAVGAIYDFCFGTTGGFAPHAWSVTGPLPPGLSLDSSTGCIQGSPTVPGTFPFTIEVCDSCPVGIQCDSLPVSIIIACAPAPTITTTSLPDCVVWGTYNECLATSGGTPPLYWSIVSGALPPGLSLDPSTGCIAGSPTVTGTFPFTVEACDSCLPASLCGTASLSITVNCQDDAYEPNNDIASAYDLRAYEAVWLSTLSGLGAGVDGDYYMIEVSPTYNQVIVDLTFSHAQGDLDLCLLDATGAPVICSNTTTDNERIDRMVPLVGGTYYVHVYPASGPLCNDYDLWWDDLIPLPPDDAYEVNNDRSTAYDLSGYKRTWLSTIAGDGVANDDDYFEILIAPGSTEVTIDARFSHALSDIDVDLYDSLGNLIAFGASTTDNEFIRTPLPPGGGTYYVLVFPYAGSGNTYDLWWDEGTGCGDDTYEPNNDLASAFDMTTLQQTALSTIAGDGVANDDDLFEILVSPGLNRVVVDVLFSHALGDIDVELLDASGMSIALADSTTDNENINFVVVATGGTFYIRVYPYGSPNCNTYDLTWDGIVP